MTDENQHPDVPGRATGSDAASYGAQQPDDRPVPQESTQQFAAPAPAAVPAERRPWKDRVLGYRGVAAVALASVILGGAGGAALGAISNGSDDGPGGMRGPGGNGPGNFGQMPGQNGQQMPGQNGMTPPGQGGQQDSTTS
ncbi:hypothetical protein [Nocardioides sp. Root151]|uniref:hypothetical protein n=1 Tax=Nocardioides sp. Root151 TaxID=1736475 RepID=UPI00070326B0|nr:hypothetical protein [Nocardioides sp. Root151]KQZ67201.1 hypothetical protein ASD66_19690 [Nocardioides sp. Root151]